MSGGARLPVAAGGAAAWRDRRGVFAAWASLPLMYAARYASLWYAATYPMDGVAYALPVARTR